MKSANGRMILSGIIRRRLGDMSARWGGCQNNLEVGDPLTGTAPISIAASNGFTYRLQELAFFSWFYGAPSIGVNGWFGNGTFLKDAGPLVNSGDDW